MFFGLGGTSVEMARVDAQPYDTFYITPILDDSTILRSVFCGCFCARFS